MNQNPAFRNIRTLFSKDRRYRYSLWRDWSEQLKQPGIFFTEDPHLAYYPGTPDKYVMFVGLNPSVADENKNDRTVARCIGYAQSWGFGAMAMSNLFAYVATNPQDMKRQADPVGSDNDVALVDAAMGASLVVAAWGTDGGYRNRAEAVLALFKREGVVLHCLKKTSEGFPAHPLYLPKSLNPTPL